MRTGLCFSRLAPWCYFYAIKPRTLHVIYSVGSYRPRFPILGVCLCDNNSWSDIRLSPRKRASVWKSTDTASRCTVSNSSFAAHIFHFSRQNRPKVTVNLSKCLGRQMKHISLYFLRAPLSSLQCDSRSFVSQSWILFVGSGLLRKIYVDWRQ